jgi:hypothetical protein
MQPEHGPAIRSGTAANCRLGQNNRSQTASTVPCRFASGAMYGSRNHSGHAIAQHPHRRSKRPPDRANRRVVHPERPSFVIPDKRIAGENALDLVSAKSPRFQRGGVVLGGVIAAAGGERNRYWKGRQPKLQHPIYKSHPLKQPLSRPAFKTPG